MKKMFSMKKALLFALICFSQNTNAQTHSLEKLWETDAIISVPESVLPDMKVPVLYVSLISGGGWEKDGIGGIGKLSPDGKTYDSTWITGLNAPKGLGKYKNYLYAADISEVVVVDIKKGKVFQKIEIPGASGLNDITVDDRGIVYVSDSRTARIWRLENGKPTLFLENIQGVNGLKAIGEDLYIGGGKEFLRAGKDKKVTKVADVPQGIDGIEPVGNGDFILTSWSGYIFYVTATGTSQTILETHQQKENAADIGFDADKRILYVPTFMANKVVAYKLK